MLDIKLIRQNPDLVKENSKNRGVEVDVDGLLAMDEQRRELITKIEELRATRNQKSKTKPTNEEISRMREVGDQITEYEGQLGNLEAKFNDLLLQIPNLTHPDTPTGGEEDYKILATQGEAPKFKFQPKDHEELLVDLGLIDFERGAKVTGAKFYFSKGALVRLNQALIMHGINMITRHGFTLVETPDLARNSILAGTGYRPRGPQTDIYSIENTDLSLIATAEITMGGYHSDEVLDLSQGPKKYVALSHCFRTEAGAAGRTQKGLYRVHQFTKLEMFVYCKPEDSDKLHQEILDIEREVIDSLELPYRVIDTASRDLGAPAYRKFDIEAWMVMRDDYGEVTSASNCTDYQARRLNIRYRTAEGQTEFVHTLNGTAIPLSRFTVAIAENYQTERGTIRVPKVLQPYLGGLEEIV